MSVHGSMAKSSQWCTGKLGNSHLCCLVHTLSPAFRTEFSRLCRLRSFALDVLCRDNVRDRASETLKMFSTEPETSELDNIHASGLMPSCSFLPVLFLWQPMWSTPS